jgi:O-antigen/teichoic acid export membrane protein
MIKSYIQKYRQSDIAKGFLALLTGSIISQAIPVAISPLLTRIYTPAEFGVFALFLSVTTILSSVSTGKYELAIFLPKEDDDAFSLVLLSSLILTAFSVVSFVVFLFFKAEIASLLGNEKIEIWLLVIPLSIFLTGIGNTLTYWYNRKRHYSKISIGNVTQTSVQASTNLTLGYLGLGIAGLIISNVFGALVKSLFYLKEIISDIKEEVKKPNFLNLREQGINYKKFPQFFIIGGFLNSLSSQLPIILFSTFYGGEVVGILAISQRMVVLPSSLISKTVGDVFRQQASDDYFKGSCRLLLLTNVKRLFFIGIIPFVVLSITAPFLFKTIFGEKWIESGIFVQLLCLMFFCQFVFSALSSVVIQVSQKLEVDVFWQIALLLSTSSAIFCGYYFFNNVYYSLGFFSIAYSLMYIISFVLAYKFSYNKKVN